MTILIEKSVHLFVTLLRCENNMIDYLIGNYMINGYTERHVALSLFNSFI